MKKKVLFIFFLNLQFPICNFQLLAQDTSNTGNIKIYQDEKIDELINFHIAYNEKNKTISGFRIHIVSDTRRDIVLEKRAEFVQTNPNVKTYFTYQQPNFKLRVGNFRTKLEAYKFLQEILPKFNSAFIVKDEIEIQ